MAHTELDVRERRLIEDLLTTKASVATITARLSRRRSAIYREIKRKCFVDDELPQRSGYFGFLAQKVATARRQHRRKLVRCPDVLGTVIEGLEAGWSPEQIRTHAP